jgi:hypothetical protein
MFDLKTSILDDEEGGELDYERVEFYINSLMAEFSESPEGKAVMEEFDGELGWAATFMELAATYFVATPATITPGETNELLFEIFPRKVSVKPEGAYQIVAELRASGDSSIERAPWNRPRRSSRYSPTTPPSNSGKSLTIRRATAWPKQSSWRHSKQAWTSTIPMRSTAS